MTESNTITSAPPTHALSVRGLRKRYGDVRAVDGIDLDIRTGEVVALLGPNGAGKSTMIEMLLGLVRPDGGDVRVFDGSPADAITTGRLGAMLQSGGIVDDAKVGELIGLVAGLHRDAMSVAEALETAGIAGLADRIFANLSGGQQQRVRFALAIVGRPELLLLDEPTTGMDVESRAAFWRSMHQQTARGRTVLFATHYIDEADAYADRVVMMRHGKIVADGTAAQIKATVVGRTIRARLADPDPAALASLPGVRDVEIRGDTVVMHCDDSDVTLRELLVATDAHDIEVTSAALEQAVLALADDHQPTETTTEASS